ncbi:DUF6265 family protein [Alteromonas sp. ASW11-36]|uniref:DUF6265 family protein n=1 Tax=Alteromonas arenosi TaxID=3055817 RepID=A0ABT7STB6_9ALTE|nr:DUF6265 family protein [Alteromonas sp. ASW11-36]MDM7859433.1 DUF6265 family protein [Alteromonas sp. ASW11-36]
MFTQFVNASDSCDSLHQTQWVLGSWVSKSNERTYEESWQKVSDKTFEGFSKITLVNGKNGGSESLRLVAMGTEVFFIAKVSHNELPIAFKLIFCSAQQLHFQNTNHDFPQSLKYHRTGDNTLSVLVEGDAEQGVKLDFVRSEGDS